MLPYRLVDCSYDRDAAAILAILNEAIVNSTAIYEYEPRPFSAMKPWFEAKEKSNFPVLGMKDEADKLLAFGSYGTFRAWSAYHLTVEHSLYVHPDHRGNKLGEAMLAALMEKAKAQNLHCLIGGIDSGNHASIALHRKMGFTHVGTLPQVGYKFDRWLDLVLYQLILES